MASTSSRKAGTKRGHNKQAIKHSFLDLIKDFCSGLKYNGKIVVKHLFDETYYSAFRVNWYEDTPEDKAVVHSEKITKSLFVVLDLETMEVKVKEPVGG